MIKAQDAAMANPEWKPGAGGQPNHCNQATAWIVGQVGGDMTPLADESGTPYKAAAIADNLGKPGSGYHVVSGEEAQSLANEGYHVLAGRGAGADGTGHVATVRPEGVVSDKIADPNPRRPFINNIGAHLKVTGVNWAFLKNEPPVFYAPDKR